MFRKLTIALGATALLAAAALAPTAASAAPHGGHGHGHGHGRHGGWHGSYGIGFYGPAFAAAPDCYTVRRVVYTPYGKRWRRVMVCD